MPITLPKTIFNIMNNPSVIGGPTTFAGIVNQKGLKPKFNAYIAKHKLIPFQVYRDEKYYFYHFKIESSDEETVYDVVIKFTENNHAHEGVLVNYDVQFFSNSPGFTYIYAYVYNKYKILVPELKDKFDSNILDEAPMRTNPTIAIGFDYPLFFAMYYLYLHQFYLEKGDIRRRGKPLKDFDLNAIDDCYEVMRKRSHQDDNEYTRFKDEAIRSAKNVSRAVKKNATTKVNRVMRATTRIVKSAKTIKPSKVMQKIGTSARKTKDSIVKMVKRK